MKTTELAIRYGKSKNGNFFIADTIGTPHPFCITPRHIDAAQKYGGMLGEAAIEDLERTTKRPSCGMKDCNLMFHQHEQALLVSCKKEIKNAKGIPNKELNEYLLSVKDFAIEDKYAGFAFVKA